jgi:DNA ligase D-like protein (predicted ligase)
MARSVARRRRAEATALPQWTAPQLAQLVDAAPDGDGWLHEIKYDGYRMHARLDRGAVTLLTRTGLDWTHKYPAIAKAVAGLDARHAFLDGELCGVGPDGITSFNIVQLASDSGNAAALVFFLFDLLDLDGEDLRPRPLIERKERLRRLLANAAPCLHYSDHVVGQGPAFYEKACAMHVEGIVSKRIDAPYSPGNRGLWRKVKCLNRAEFVVVGWTDPEGRRPHLGALLLGYYDPNGRLIYAGRAGTGIDNAELERLWRRLQPLATGTMPLDVPPPRSTRFQVPGKYCPSASTGGGRPRLLMVQKFAGGAWRRAKDPARRLHTCAFNRTRRAHPRFAECP